MSNLPNIPMALAAGEAAYTMIQDIGGPFGAAIVDADGNLVAVASNTVLRDHDPTAHAEINAIRQACAKLGTHDLSGCVLYATGYPCPMCLSAIIWANIRNVYYACTPEDAEAIGFRDDFIYRYIRTGCNDDDTLVLACTDREYCKSRLFDVYADMKKTIY